MVDDGRQEQLAELRSRVRALEERLETAIELLARLRPASAMLTAYGADDQQQRSLNAIVDEMTARADEGIAASYTEFEERVALLLPHTRGDRRFLELLIESFRLERPRSKGLFDHLSTAMALFRS